jgi:hypothetical protein
MRKNSIHTLLQPRQHRLLGIGPIRLKHTRTLPSNPNMKICNPKEAFQKGTLACSLYQNRGSSGGIFVTGRIFHRFICSIKPISTIFRQPLALSRTGLSFASTSLTPCTCTLFHVLVSSPIHRCQSCKAVSLASTVRTISGSGPGSTSPGRARGQESQRVWPQRTQSKRGTSSSSACPSGLLGPGIGGNRLRHR